MITYIVGIPGSGKTYLAVYKIYENFIKQHKKSFFNKKSKDSKYNFCFTNINGFKFDISDKIRHLDIDNFKYNLLSLYEMYSLNASDDELINKAKEYNLYKSLIVIDEAHNFFGLKKDEVLIWFLTYHRHLFVDLILITQDLSLIDTQYKSIAEFFYKAVEGAKRILTNRFRYVQFSSYKMYQVDLVKGGGFTLPQLKEVFGLYVSGNESKSKSIVLFYLFIFLVLIVLLVSFVSYFVSSFKTKANKDNDVDDIFSVSLKKEDSVVSNKIINYSNDNFFYHIHCVLDNCIINNSSDRLNKNYVLDILNNSPPVFYEINRKIKFVEDYYVSFKTPVFEKFLKKVRDEKDTFNSDLFN